MLWGASPLYETGSLKEISIPNDLSDRQRGEGNCAGVTEGGKEAGAKAARLRTETSYKAGSVRRVSPSSRSRSQLTDQVKGELVQRNITFLSGETCIDGSRAVVAPGSKACLKAWNRPAQAGPRDHRLQPGHLDGPAPERTASLPSRLDGLLRLGSATETVRSLRSMDQTSHPDVLLRSVGVMCAHVAENSSRWACRAVKRSATLRVAKALGTWPSPLPAVSDSPTIGCTRRDYSA